MVLPRLLAAYGVVKRDKVLIWANIVGVTNAAILIACIIIYA